VSQPSPPVRLSIVIVNYNTREDLRACLTAVYTCEPRPEIIVVDNGSTDGSAAMVSQQFPDVVLLVPGHNLWFTGGNNLGIAVAHGDYVLLLNPDTLPTPTALLKLVAYADLHPEVAGVTAQLRYPDGVIQRTCSRIPSYAYLLWNHTVLGWLMPKRRARLRDEHWYAGWDRDTDRDVEVVPGSCLLARRGSLLLDESLLLYYPEDDLAQQLKGAKFHFLADATIIHREKAATRTWLATEIYFRDMLTYTGKYHGAPARALLWLLSRPVIWGMWLKRVMRESRS
jgi:GT2 family glycosyltransferase